MQSESGDNLHVEIGHVLFIDIVGYSRLLIEEQKQRLNQLSAIVLATAPVREATDEQLVRLPTGDGMALVFRHSAEEPARCALEISEALQKHPELPVRMGIHSGPVSEVQDVSGRTNIAGAGINMAQRVMDCGDAGHILLSQHVADDLVQYRQWAPRLHDLGDCEVKHGVRLHLVNLYAEPLGNAALPEKFKTVAAAKSGAENRARRRSIAWVSAAALLAILAAGAISYFASRRPATAPLAAADNSIAVLPFADMSQAKDQGYFSDGISEELLNLLGKIPQLKVAARTSSFSFKGKTVEIPEIARQLRVAHVLEGSVRTSGDQLRITAQLVRAADGYHLWSETYDRKLDDIFKIQDEIAGKVVGELRISLLGAAPKVRETDPKAYALYLQGREVGRQHTPEAFVQSDALYRQALAIDPHYVPAWNGLSFNFITKAIFVLIPSKEGFDRAREAAEKALQIDPDDAPAHGALGWIAMYHNNLAGAAKHFERALALDSTGLCTRCDASDLLMILGRMDEGLALREAIVRRDPVNVSELWRLGIAQRGAGRYDAAIASYRTALSIRPAMGVVRSHLGIALLLKGDASGALTEIEQEKIEAYRMIALPMAYHALGRAADSDAALGALIAKYEKDYSFNIAYVYAFCGNADKAFEWLEKAVEYHDAGLSEIVQENLFQKIHSDPRWVPFLRKLGKAPEQLARIEFKMPPLP